MQISRKSEYAVRAMAILGSQGDDRSMQARELSRSGEIPQKFLEQILLVLKRSGLVVSKRGVGGGYRIACHPRHISVADVVQCIEGDTELFEEGERPDFPGSAGVLHCFTTASQAYWHELRDTTIEDLLNHGSPDSMVGFGI